MNAQDLTQMSATDLARQLRDRSLTAEAVMGAYLDRIDAANPAVNAIVSMRDRDGLLAEAAALDKGEISGPLHGLPMAPKDLSDTAGLRTTYGSPAFADHVPDTDSQLAARLRAAGAVFVGKSNTPEFGLGSNTYNPVHGITRNPYDLGRTCGGSSGGAAVALATRMLPVADGSDMMGSLRNPAGWCNIYGFRPSYGMVPQEPRGESFHKQLSTAGPMARHPQDLRLLLDVLSRPEPRAPHPAPVQRTAPTTIRWIGDWGGHLPMEDGVLELCRSALDVLGARGFRIETACPRIDPAELWTSWTDLRSWSVATELAPLYNSEETRARFKPEALWEVERGLAISGMAVSAASTTRSEWFREMETENVLWAIPSAQVFPFGADIDWPKSINGVAMDTYHRWMECVIPCSLIGAPGVSLPAGFKGSAPIGVQLFGPRGIDHALIEIAEVYHAATHWPDARPTVV